MCRVQDLVPPESEGIPESYLFCGVRESSPEIQRPEIPAPVEETERACAYASKPDLLAEEGNRVGQAMAGRMIARGARGRQAIIGRGSGSRAKKGGSGLKTAITPELRQRVFFVYLKENGIPLPEVEYPFAQSKGRRFRMDYAWPDHSVGLEQDGGVFLKGGGRHTRGSGWMKDSEKLNLACVMGWRMLRCTPQQLCTPEMIEVIKQALAYEDAA
jgi:hypothetical protein